MAKEEFGSYRLKKSTITFLHRMKKAFELAYQKDFTNDEFIKQMGAAVEDGDVAVWEFYTAIEEMEEKLNAKAKERRTE